MLQGGFFDCDPDGFGFQAGVGGYFRVDMERQSII